MKVLISVLMLVMCIILYLSVYESNSQVSNPLGSTYQVITIAEEVIKSNKKTLNSIFGTASISWQVAQTQKGDSLIMLFGGSSDPIVVMRMDAKGNCIWNPDKIVLRDGDYRVVPQILADKKEGFFIAWKQTGPDGLYLKRINSEGKLLFETPITDKDIRTYSLTLLEDNSILIPFSTNKALFVKFINNEGEMGWKKNQILLDTINSQINPVSSYIFSDGSAIIVWIQYDEKGNLYMGQRIDIENGKSLWKNPVALGPAPLITWAPPPKPIFEKAGENLTITLYKGKFTDVEQHLTEYKIFVGTDGDIK